MARREKKRKFERTIAIVGDGFTEKIYFEQLRKFENLKDVVIKPELPKKSGKGGNYKKSIATAEALAEDGYTHVYCLIDLDTVLSEDKLTDFAADLKAIDNKNITIYINSPCFETWILMHYQKTGRVFKDCDAAVDAVVKHAPDYSKKQEYLTNKEIYKLLRPFLETHAIPNAKFLENGRDEKGDRYPRAEVYKFFECEKIIALNEVKNTGHAKGSKVK